MPEICQKSLPITPWMDPRTRRLPGLNPVLPGQWLLVDEVYAAQMAYRARLLAEQRAAVHQLSEPARPAAEELLQRVLAELRLKPDFTVNAGTVYCPDGREVAIDRDNPLITCGHLVQEDFNIVQQRDGEPGGEHVLTGSVLCFPASWVLAEKFMQPLSHIHGPIAAYTPDIAKRVQRLFNLIKVDQPLWRANFLIYSDPDLFQPRWTYRRRVVDPDGPKWMRVERQSLLKLPDTGAVVFSIHSYVVPMGNLSVEQRAALKEKTAS